MNDIVNNVLELSRRKAPQESQIQINEWIKEIVSSIFPDAFHRHLFKFECTENLFIMFDESQLKQVITNLIENAMNSIQDFTCQQTAEAHSILIHVFDDKVQERPTLEIIDSGPGIHKNHAEHIFEPFFTQSKKGSGLGLFICKEICDLNNASISSMPSTRNDFKGARFIIQFKPALKQILKRNSF